MSSDARWATSVRVLAVVSALLLVVTVLEARAVRQARAELQQLRSEREQVKSGIASEWTRQSGQEFGQALRWLDEFSADVPDGLGVRGGLCPGGRLSEGPIVAFAVGEYVPARASGLSSTGAIDAMRKAILKSDAFRVAHPTRVQGK